MKRIISLILLVVMAIMLTACGTNSSISNGSDNNSTTEKDNEQTKDNNSSIQEDDYIVSRKIANALKQEHTGNDIHIILENNKDVLTLDELFSYSPNYIVEVYALSDSLIDYSKKAMSLNVGYNHFQVLFKNLSDYSEISYDIKIFRDPGEICRKINRYMIFKEYSQNRNENGFLEFDFKFYIQKGIGNFITINGEDIPAKIIECNVDMVYYANFYVDSENYMPSTNFPHQYMDTFSLSHKFINEKEIFETTVSFPEIFWLDCRSKSPFLTLENSTQGVYERYPYDIDVSTDSYILLCVDYSNYQFN